MSCWIFPLEYGEWAGDCVGCNAGDHDLPEAPHHLGGFSARRKHHTHEGVDLYALPDALVHAVEDGEVVAIGPFTGADAGSPWWENTMFVMVEGESGVVNYGEITPYDKLKVGSKVKANDRVGWVKTVLKKNKGRPMTMLHLELYKPGTREPVEWKPGEPQPECLLDPTPFLRANYRVGPRRLTPSVRVDRERERCAQAAENLIAHRHHWDPKGTATADEALALLADRIRKREFGPVVWDGWPHFENDPDKCKGEGP